MVHAHHILLCAHLPREIVVVKYLHSKKIIHNDLHGSNILINDEKNIPYIIDFGMATNMHQGKVYNIAGTSRHAAFNRNHPYLAHELRNKPESRTCAATDVYSLGYCLYILTPSGSSVKNTVIHDISKRMMHPDRVKRLLLEDVVIKLYAHLTSLVK